MRIGIDLRALMEGKTTGVEVYIINLLHSLFTIDSENEYILFVNSWGEISPLVREFRYPNVALKHLHYSNKIFNLFQKFLRYPKLNKILGGADIIFFPHWRVAAVQKDIPVIAVFHDLSYKIIPEFFTTWQRFWHLFMDYENAAKTATRVIAVSGNTGKDLIEYYRLDNRKISVIYPGIPPSSKEDVKPEQNLLEKSYFLYLGTFEPRKNLPMALKAYEEYCTMRVSPRTLVLAGHSGWGTKLLIPQAIKNRVQVFKNISGDRKTALVKNAFALVFPSFYEGFGFSMIEAASERIPVIAGSGSSLPEIAGEFALLVSPFRSGELAHAMLRLEEDNELREMLLNRGKQKVQSFRWDETAREILNMFKQTYEYANRH